MLYVCWVGVVFNSKSYSVKMWKLLAWRIIEWERVISIPFVFSNENRRNLINFCGKLFKLKVYTGHDYTKNIILFQSHWYRNTYNNGMSFILNVRGKEDLSWWRHNVKSVWLYLKRCDAIHNIRNKCCK